MDLVTRSMILQLKHVFLSDNGEEYDPVSPTVEIVHYNGSTEVVDLAVTSLVRIKTGHYIYTWTVPDTFPINVVAFAYFRCIDGHGYNLIFEQTYRVVPTGFYTVDRSNMVIKFNKD